MAASISYPYSTFLNEQGSQWIDTTIMAESVVFGGQTKEEREERLLAKLPYAAEATVHHYSRQGDSLCMADTRSQRIHWLTGMAGTGKSTIARTIARTCYDEGRLGASFFFSRGGGEREKARTFVTTIAVQLARRHAQLRAEICEAVRKQPDIAQHALSDQWKQLVLRPCERMRAAAPGALQCAPLVIVVDALDECHAADEIEFVLALLSQTSGLAVAELRILLTSRPEIPIREGLLGMPESSRRHLVLHQIDPSVVGRDIRVFLERSLAQGLRNSPWLADMSDDEVLHQLEQRAGGLFIWAATVCRFILEGGPIGRKRLAIILKRDLPSSGTHPELKLDDIYIGILRTAVSNNLTGTEREEFCNILRTVLGTIAVSFSSLSVPSLASLLSLPYHEVLDSLRDLHSVIDVSDDCSEPIRLQHASVRDFLLDDRRCSDACFRVDELEAHTNFAHCCLFFMNHNLKKNICRLAGPGAITGEIARERLDQHIPPPLRYACLYWVQHIQLSQQAEALRNPVNSFMREHFLHWLEVLGLTGRMSEAVEALALLGTLYDRLSRLGQIISDAKQFALSNRRMIEEAPLQAYLSALLFTPTKSVIRLAFSYELPPWLTRLPTTPDDWSEEWLSLEGHFDTVGAVAFSPDNRLIASGSDDTTVRMWDITTGAARGTLEGHTGCVGAVKYSPDGLLLASASYDNTIRLWRVNTGAAFRTLVGHSLRPVSLAFSPDGLFLASASRDSTIRLWSTESGAARGILEGHTAAVRCVTFLSDGQLLASASCDRTVKLWDYKTTLVDRTVKLLGASAYEFSETDDDSMAFSSNARLLAIGLCDASVQLWDTMTGAAIGTFHNGSFISDALAFSPNSQFLASAADDDGVALWSVETEALSTAQYRQRAYSIAFSQDGHFLAMGLGDGTIRLLNGNPGTVGDDCHLSPIKSMCFSPDGTLLASGSDDGTVNVFDAKTDAVHATWKGLGPSHFITAVAFSPDGKLLASGSQYEDVLLRDLNTEASCSTLAGHSITVFDIAFSPDGKTLATASHDMTVRLWSVETRAPRLTLAGHSGFVFTVSFSPDGHLLASGSDDNQVRLWYVNSGAEYHILVGHSGAVRGVAFSPDSKLLGSASIDRTVRIWKPHTSEQLHVIRDEGSLYWLKFSADGRFITTNRGAHRLPHDSSGASAVSAVADSCHVLAMKDRWLTCNMENLLWIPPDYRAGQVAIHDHTVAFGLKSGCVVFLSFDFSRGIPW